jgi:uncharacterized membrane protein YphA (DoxX/SURF4 family)
MNTQTLRQLHLCKTACRTALGLVWLYEGLIPKIWFPAAHPEQTELVMQSHLWWGTPELTLLWLGTAQAVLGLLLLSGQLERPAVLLATGWMAALIVLVVAGRPLMLTDPFGAIAKDFCLFACALVVWVLARVLESSEARYPAAAR